MPDLALSGLDEGSDARLDPDVWQRNLAALAAVGWPALNVLAATTLPPHFRLRRSIDGWLSFRVEPAGEQPCWLDRSGAPLTRAEALLSMYACGELNATMPGAGSGAELSLLLERLPRHKAVFVWEWAWLALAAALHVVDVAEAIRSRRLILIPPDGGAYLESLLDAEPGLLPPGNILRLPHVSGEWIEQVHARCARLSAEVLARRSAALRELKVPAPVPAAAGPPRLALLTTQPDGLARFATALVRDSCGGSVETLRSAVDDPPGAHPLIHARRLVEFAPTHTIFVNQPPLPVCGDSPAASQWYLSTGAAARAVPGSAALLPATPAVEAALRRCVAASQGVVPFYWACVGDESPNDELGDEIALCVDRHDDSAAACGVDQPTHRMLWDKMRDLARRLWETPDGQRADALLARAERETGLGVAERDVREKLVQLAAGELIPAATTERIIELLRHDDQRAVLVGSGWGRPARATWVPGGAIQPGTGEDFWTQVRLNRPRAPLAAVFAGGADPFAAALPIAGAMGWPLIVHAPAADVLGRALGGLLTPGQHVAPFASYRDLIAALRRLRDDPRERQRIGRRTHEHLVARHTYRQRVAALLTSQGGP
ncbi:MAG: hypothetical protein CHACPFDD_01675 [Phycisphaerae bacterium]|nr:hypothetical protein [Phycisphaerae bacterium]